MARTNATNYSNPNYAYATADNDAFDRLDVAAQGQAMDVHDHSSGNGVAVARVATGALADGSVTNAKLASDTARANLLTNGGFEIWQRGSGPFTAIGGAAVLYTADRWAAQLGSGAGNLAVTRVTSGTDRSPTAAQLTYTAGAGDSTVSFHQQTDSIGDVPFMRWNGPLSLSIRVQCSAAGRARLWWWDGVASGRQYGSYNVAVGVMETLSMTFTPAASATKGYFGIELLAGTSSTVYVDNAMLVVGSQAADYAPLHPADDLARCLRYYETLGGSTSIIVRGYASAAGQSLSLLGYYKVRKVVTPTVTMVGTMTANNSGTINGINGSTVDSVELLGTSGTAGPWQFFFTNASNYLTIEANL